MNKDYFKKMTAGLLGTAVVIALAGQVNAMTITDMDSAGGLASALIGTGVTISNATYTGANQAAGYFSGGIAAGIGMESGIVLTNGRADSLNGTINTGDGKSTSNNTVGNSHLDALIAPDTTNDATTLSFDFQFNGDSGGNAYFNFVFGSEEYNEWVDDYNDVFAFFLDGSAPANNVALIPGTNTPVSIDNVNNDVNADYYNDNDYGDFKDTGTTPFPFEYDGFTDVITVSMLDLDSGTHHLELSIADAVDMALDSGVFIQGESFGNVLPPDNNTPVPEPSSIFLLGSGLLGLIGSTKKKWLMGLKQS